MASNYTENFSLCQWEATNQVLRTEFNEDNAKLDVALAEHAQLLEQVTATIGNCSLYATTYIGTGKSGQTNAVRLTFPKAPKAVLVTSDECLAAFLYPDDCGTAAMYGRLLRIICSWDISSKTVSWYHPSDATNQLNTNNTIYRVVALAAD